MSIKVPEGAGVSIRFQSTVIGVSITPTKTECPFSRTRPPLAVIPGS